MAEKVLGPAGSRRRRRFGFVRATMAGGTLMAFLVVFVAASGGVLAPSTFEGNDGNMLVNVAGRKDWANVNPAIFTDGTKQDDDSISGGAEGGKEDSLFPEIVTQSTPPKDDLLKIALQTEFVSGSNFLYAASIRRTTSGSSHVNYELNKGTAGTSPNGVTPNRVAGDRLITFDFTAGGTKAEINLLTWKTSGACLEAPAPPCWGDLVDLDQSGFAEGAANDGQLGRSGALTAPQNTISGVALDANQFQEMAVNLTSAGILPSNVCATFAFVTTKSRSSGSSFLSALKDVHVANRPISNCGSVQITKTDDAGNALSGVKFDLYVNNAPLAAPRGAEDTLTNPLKTCTTGSAGTCTISDVTFGSYWVVEDPATIPAGHNGAPDQAVSITTGGQVVQLTFVNPRQPGRINIHKQDDSATPVALANVTFKLYNDAAPVGGSRGAEDTLTNPLLSCTTNASGDCSILNVPLGNYWVVEDPATVPAGYAAAADQAVSLSTGGQAVNLTFTDPRLHKVITFVCHEGSNTLHSTANNVTLDGQTKTSSATVPAPLAGKGVTQADICSITAGASFGGKAHGTFNGSVTVGGH